MKITLNKANKLARLVEASIVRTYLNLPASTNIVLIRSVEQARDEYDQARHIVLDALDDTAKKVKTLYDLRRLIGQTNVENGVHILMNEIAYLNFLISKFALLTNPVGFDIKDYPEIKKSVDDAKEDKKFGQTIQISLFSKEEVQGRKDGLDDLKKKLRDKEEERNALNHKILLDLPDIIVDHLTSIKLL